MPFQENPDWTQQLESVLAGFQDMNLLILIMLNSKLINN